MPRVSREISDQHRIDIEIAAAKLFREHGLNGISVANLMAAVGLTHGSFYSHFESKDHLAELACTRAFDQSAQRWGQILADSANEPAPLAAVVNRYLRESNRIGPVADCPAATLAGDIAREPATSRARQAYVKGVDSLATTLEHQFAKFSETARSDSLVLLSTLVGALILARATNGSPLSEEIQSAVTGYLVASDLT